MTPEITAAGEQHQDHEVGELLEQQAQGPAAGAFLDLVGADALQALRCFHAAQPPVRHRCPGVAAPVRGQQMPGGRLVRALPAGAGPRGLGHGVLRGVGGQAAVCEAPLDELNCTRAREPSAWARPPRRARSRTVIRLALPRFPQERLQDRRAVEEAFATGMELGVPLHAVHEARSVPADRLDDPIGLAATFDDEAGAQIAHRLMVNGVDQTALLAREIFSSSEPGSNRSRWKFSSYSSGS